MPASPTISVIMPVYNAGRFLRTAVRSILSQTYRDFEFIIVDDGSTDSSPRILRSFAEETSRIRLVTRPNMGIVAALNEGLGLAKGEFIARMDADDIAVPTRLEIQYAFMLKHTDCVALGCQAYFIDPEGALLKLYHNPCDHAGIMAELLAGNGGALVHPGLMLRRTAVISAGGYREEFRHAEDYDLFLRLANVGQLANTKETLLYYRQHLNSIKYKHREIQVELSRKLLMEACASRGVEPKPISDLDGDYYKDPVSIRRQWAFWSVEGGNLVTALKHALLAWLQEPWSSASRSCLGYVIEKELDHLAR